jgi:DNA-binding CsgD family transcriptional regulator
MLEAVFSNLVNGYGQNERAEGVAFFKVAKSLYRLDSVEYLAVNIPVPSRQQQFVQCIYSDSRVKHCITNKPLATDALTELRLTEPELTNLRSWPGEDSAHNRHENRHSLTFSLRSQFKETAYFAISASMEAPEWEESSPSLFREVRALANYFHGHVLRINGHNSDDELLISARELDCLKWTAAGKTAWEASVILGISERTVRFHLNAAREKLKCTTTTQAVAKAISKQWIDV